MVEQIKELCAAHNTNIKSLEKELGFGNGTIRRWDERKPSYDRIESVARRFGVTVEYLLTGEEKEKSPAPNGAGLSEHEQRVLTLFHQFPEEEWEGLLMAVEVAMRNRGLLE